MATRLVAAIQAALDIEVALVQGHNGIYEVTIDNEVVYTNRGQCDRGFPDEGDIVARIGQFIGVTPRPRAPQDSPLDSEQGPACPLPGPGPDGSVTDRQGETISGCGCGPTHPIAPAGSACCGPGNADPQREAPR